MFLKCADFGRSAECSMRAATDRLAGRAPAPIVCMISRISASRGKVVSIVTISAVMDFLGDGGKRPRGWGADLDHFSMVNSITWPNTGTAAASMFLSIPGTL